MRKKIGEVRSGCRRFLMQLKKEKIRRSMPRRQDYARAPADGEENTGNRAGQSERHHPGRAQEGPSYIAEREKIVIRVAPGDLETVSGNRDF